MIKVTADTDFSNTETALNKLNTNNIEAILNECGRTGVAILSEATPKNTGKTAASWSYEIERKSSKIIVHWINSNVQGGSNIALIIQEGHATKSGKYIEGIDYINPAMREIFRSTIDNIWKGVIE